MIELRFTRAALADLERFTVALEVVLDALQVLRLHPYIGRPAERGLRELVISRGPTGYLALYAFHPAMNEVLVATLRPQVEAGYSAE